MVVCIQFINKISGACILKYFAGWGLYSELGDHWNRFICLFLPKVMCCIRTFQCLIGKPQDLHLSLGKAMMQNNFIIIM